MILCCYLYLVIVEVILTIHIFSSRVAELLNTFNAIFLDFSILILVLFSTWVFNWFPIHNEAGQSFDWVWFHSSGKLSRPIVHVYTFDDLCNVHTAWAHTNDTSTRIRNINNTLCKIEGFKPRLLIPKSNSHCSQKLGCEYMAYIYVKAISNITNPGTLTQSNSNITHFNDISILFMLIDLCTLKLCYVIYFECIYHHNYVLPLT